CACASERGEGASEQGQRRDVLARCAYASQRVAWSAVWSSPSSAPVVSSPPTPVARSRRRCRGPPRGAACVCGSLGVRRLAAPGGAHEFVRRLEVTSCRRCGTGQRHVAQREHVSLIRRELLGPVEGTRTVAASATKLAATPRTTCGSGTGRPAPVAVT